MVYHRMPVLLLLVSKCSPMLQNYMRVHVITEKQNFNTILVLYIIRKTCPCKVYSLKPHFYIVKLGYAGVYLFFLFLLQNIDCGYSLEPPRRGGSNVSPQSMF